MKNQEKLTWEDIKAKHANLTWEDITAMYVENSRMIQELRESQKESERMRKENERILTENFDRAQKERAERDRALNELFSRNEKERIERERALNEQFERDQKERIERERALKEQFERDQKERAERDRILDEKFSRTEKMIANSNERIEGISKSNGEFCEEYFINSFKENPVLLGEKFDRVLPYLYPEPMVVNDEYDLVLRNGSTVALIEMKYKAKASDVGKMFSKLHSYRANYPMFKDYKIYLCLASFRFRQKVRDCAAEKGIVLIQQQGDKIEIVSENVRAW